MAGSRTNLMTEATVRALIVDDEPAGRGSVATLLLEHPRIRVVGEATNGNEAVELARELKPDLLFLDIQMPDLDGFGVLERLGGEVPRGVVFVTAHDDHAIRAFEMHALDYVLKPFGRPRFTAAVERALERLEALDALTMQRTLATMAEARKDAGAQAGELSVEHADRPAPPKRIGVRTGTRVIVVDVDSIDWVEADGDYARIHTGKQAHLVSQTLQAIEKLFDGGSFVRIHRSLIVNGTRVKEMHRESDGSGAIVLDGGVRLRVARGRWEMLEKWLRLEKL